LDTQISVTELISPYGGELIDLTLPETERRKPDKLVGLLPSVQISQRSVCNLELLGDGSFSPLRTFMNEADFRSVAAEMRLSDGSFFPVPVTLPVENTGHINIGEDVVLRDSRNDPLAVMSVSDIYEWSKAEYAEQICGTDDLRHPLVAEIQHWGKFNISGKLRLLNPPVHRNFPDLRLTPRQVREKLKAIGNRHVVAFHTRNPLHLAHEEIIRRAVERTGGTLLLHPAVGVTKPGDIDYVTRVRTYRTLVENFFQGQNIRLAILPLAMLMAGPREALFHALIRRNYGADHFIVGRDHASPGNDSRGIPFYPKDAAAGLLEKHSVELGIGVLAFDEMVYLPEEKRYEEIGRLPPATKFFALSGTQIREEYLNRGKPLPDWFTRPEISAILTENHRPDEKPGVCLWFTGLSGAGKSTTAEVLTSRLTDHGRRVTLLDGDVVRTHLSEGLGFSKQDRDTNVRRIGFVASEIVRHGGIAICAAISPYRAARNEVRQMVGDDKFIEIFVDTPLEVCEKRDTKGMYAKARNGEIRNFTGVDDVYESPENAEITLDTTDHTVEENVRRIMDFLAGKGFTKSYDTNTAV
jgi:sulfate adenylyltransferase